MNKKVIAVKTLCNSIIENKITCVLKVCASVTETYTCTSPGCPAGQDCLTNPDNGQPVCTTCNSVCLPSVTRELCGTDGRTYANYCHMTSSACARSVYVTTRRNGACKTSSKKNGMMRMSFLSIILSISNILCTRFTVYPVSNDQ